MKTSGITKANVFALGLVLNMILYKFYGGVFVSVFGANTLATLIITNLIVYGVPVIVYFMFSMDYVSDIIKINNPGILNILIITAISVFIQPLLMLISGISSLFFEPKTADYISTFMTLPLYYTILSTAFFPALTEEIAFRGIVFSNLKEKTLLKACVFSGLLFGMAHLNGEQFFYAFFMGIIFSYFVQRTDSIISSIVSHFVINGSQTLMTLYMLKQGTYNAQESAASFADLLPNIKLAAISLIPLATLFLVFEGNYRKKQRSSSVSMNISEYAFDSDESMLKPSFFIFLVVFAAYALFS
ncbi:MAG: CPBP family intramembrane metalloprotease [Firmicutes bacterium]|nr:CPBP family intramembrane metalloprotease [Bacillota bacterium]